MKLTNAAFRCWGSCFWTDRHFIINSVFVVMLMGVVNNSTGAGGVLSISSTGYTLQSQHLSSPHRSTKDAGSQHLPASAALTVFCPFPIRCLHSAQLTARLIFRFIPNVNKNSVIARSRASCFDCAIFDCMIAPSRAWGRLPWGHYRAESHYYSSFYAQIA
jgi:hypothetical protein